MAMMMNVNVTMNMIVNIATGEFLTIFRCFQRNQVTIAGLRSATIASMWFCAGHMRQSISLEYLLRTRKDAANTKKMLSIFW
jgi:hypothetical protein